MIPASIMIFGATGESGYRLAERLIKAGRRIIGVDWKGCHFKPLERLGVEIEIADVNRLDSLAQAFHRVGDDDTGVVTFLGGSPLINSQGNISVINAALDGGLSRFVLVTSIGCGESRSAIDPFTEAFIGKALRAKTWAESHLRNTSLDWTIVRPGGPMVRRPTGNGVLFDTPHVTGHINRIDLGDVICSVLQNPATIGQTLSAIDRDKAMSTTEEPVRPAVI